MPLFMDVHIRSPGDIEGALPSWRSQPSDNPRD
jgi:hypothetical protein